MNKNHPLLTDTAIFPTSSLEDFITEIRLWIESLIPGGIVYGHQRVGKTQAIKYLIKNAEQLLDSKIPIVLLSAWEPTPTSTTENRFFSELLYSLNYASPNYGNAGVKRRRIVSQMLEDVRQNKEHRYIMFIDEAQWLTKSQLRYLMDIHNLLKINGVRLIAILVGQPELQSLKEDLLNLGEKHLIARFMVASHNFGGLTDENSFKRILDVFDMPYETFKGSEISFTEYFVPKAYKSGFRLSSYSRQLWIELISSIESDGVKVTKELPMQPITAYLRLLLVTLSKMDDEEISLPENLLGSKMQLISMQFRDLSYQNANHWK